MVVEAAEGRHRSALRQAGPVAIEPSRVRLVVAGEALIDLVTTDGERYAAHVGGSPLNVAVGAARLGLRTELLARISTDPLGDRIARHLADNHVGDRLVRRVDLPSSLAVATLDGRADAAYDFYLDGTANTGWETVPHPGDVDLLHVGSLAMQRDPGPFERLATRVGQGGGLVSYDPNIRPAAAFARAAEADRVRRQVALADVVKASADDIRWLYPGADAMRVARDWLAAGPSLVVITAGAEGATALTRERSVVRPASAVEVVDTVGAGDSVTAGLLCALAERELRSGVALAALTRDELTGILDFALRCAAITVSRAGAAPPTRDDVAGSL